MTRWNEYTPRRDRISDPMQDLRPTIWIGKQGCTETIIREVIAQLEKRKIIKVKWLQNTEMDPGELAGRAGAELISVRGRTMVLTERRKR
jgi:RNA-binding protein